jgi:two-component system, chemotaxis family, CheB/CheR fusion protein
VADPQDEQFDDLLELLKRTRGFDFSGYKRTTLARRVAHRMQALEIVNYGDYVDYLELHPEEYTRLFDTVLINVTGFFRDQAAWEVLAKEVIPDLLAQKAGGRPIRVWSAGCASGEEAYSIAILLAEEIGVDAFRDQIKIYATDVDEEALQIARGAAYDDKHLAGVPEKMREQYFEPSGTRRVFRRDLRRSIIFGRNDLTQDAPISRVDLLISRNTLMYFNSETQGRILRRFHFALTETGYLFLGKAEMLLNHGALFMPMDLRRRIFKKVASSRVTDAAQPGGHGRNPIFQGTYQRIESAALASSPIAQLAVDPSGVVVVANAKAESLFNLGPRDVGRPIQDLEVSYRPIELRSLIEQVMQERRPIELRDIHWQRVPGVDAVVLDVLLSPLPDRPTGLAGVGVSFVDVTQARQLRDELEHANKDLERAYEELQSTNEELETTNEELQSTNEELETTNEELQSTVEELETINEELQSTNDELQDINHELRDRSIELGRVDSFLGAVLASLGSAVAVVDADLLVQAWSPGAEELWGMRADEVLQKHFLTLDIGLPVHEVAPRIRELLNGRSGKARNAGPLAVEAVNRRGRTITVRVSPAPLRADDRRVVGVILVMDPIEQKVDDSAKAG